MLRASLAHKSEEETSVTVRRFLRQSNSIASAWFNEKKGKVSEHLPLHSWDLFLSEEASFESSFESFFESSKESERERERKKEEMVLAMHSFSFLISLLTLTNVRVARERTGAN